MSTILYTYLCKDGAWRTRCGRHIARRPTSLSPVFFPPDHPRERVPTHAEFAKAREKTSATKTPVFIREEKPGNCLECGRRFAASQMNRRA